MSVCIWLIAPETAAHQPFLQLSLAHWCLDRRRPHGLALLGRKLWILALPQILSVNL